jgi:hypothetical protein
VALQQCQENVVGTVRRQINPDAGVERTHGGARLAAPVTIGGAGETSDADELCLDRHDQGQWWIIL